MNKELKINLNSQREIQQEGAQKIMRPGTAHHCRLGG
ncbi:MAG: hypothetical protein CM1200mP28_15970 [Deltaproteobacteria bacterium]|nr:MAG: hypothetical protein CM1200mP28_15970 [Deltaproteobacteria bacterium]